MGARFLRSRLAMMRISSSATLCIVMLVACADRPSDNARPASADSGLAPTSASSMPRCFRDEHSVLLGPSKRTGSGAGSNWIRLDDASDSDSGAAQLIDADGARLGGTWRRLPSDSIDLIAFDDFLRVELRLDVTPDLASGRASAHSDAEIERDSAGRQTELRRSWTLSAPQGSCDSVPPRSLRSP